MATLNQIEVTWNIILMTSLDFFVEELEVH